MLSDRENQEIINKVDERYDQIHFIGFAKGFWAGMAFLSVIISIVNYFSTR